MQSLLMLSLLLCAAACSNIAFIFYPRPFDVEIAVANAVDSLLIAACRFIFLSIVTRDQSLQSKTTGCIAARGAASVLLLLAKRA